jgi:hypothetical protein
VRAALSALESKLDSMEEASLTATLPAARQLTLADVTTALPKRGGLSFTKLGIAAGTAYVRVSDTLHGLTEQERSAALSMQGLTGAWVGGDPGEKCFLTAYSAASSKVYYIGEGFAAMLQRLYLGPLAVTQSQFDKVSAPVLLQHSCGCSVALYTLFCCSTAVLSKRE